MCFNWIKDQWFRMWRIKPQSTLGRERSSTGSVLQGTERIREKYSRLMNWAVIVGIVCYSLTLGVSLTLLEFDGSLTLSTMAVALVLAGIFSILSGLNTAEYLSSQCTPSVYTGCYQSTGEFLAFIIGWTWLASQAAIASALCQILSHYLHLSTQQSLQKLLENALYSYAAEAPAAIFAMAAGLVLLTGMGEKALSFVVAMPGTIVLLGAVFTVELAKRETIGTIFSEIQEHSVQHLETVLSTISIFVLFFNGPSTITRASRSQIRNQASTILSCSNIVSLILAAMFVLLSTLTFKNSDVTTKAGYTDTLIICILIMIAVFMITIEVFHLLHIVIDEMASDGLLCRSLAKKWTPFCFPIAPPFVHVITVVAVGVVSVLSSSDKLLKMAVLHPIFVNAVVPLFVLWQRYRDNNSWQYEPMRQASTQLLPKHRSRLKSQEFEFVRNAGYDVTETMCIASQDSSDTDIDSVVEQYKEQTRIANLTSLDDSDTQEAPEPTPSTAKRAKCCIYFHLVGCIVISVILNATNLGDAEVVCTSLLVLSFCILGVVFTILTFLPKNTNRTLSHNCTKRINQTPLFPCLASLAMFSLFFHIMMHVWDAALCWMAIGLLVYFTYSARNSTAATSFYNLPAGHVALQPLPNHVYSCIPQVVSSHRKSSKSRKLKLHIRHR